MTNLASLTTSLLLTLAACTSAAPLAPATPLAPTPVAVAPAPPVAPPTPSDADLRAALAARRAHHLEVLATYRKAGVFPINDTVKGDGHFLIDRKGTLCAVANLIAADGHRDLIVAESKVNNGLLFASVERGPLADWIATSGFTKDEIALIQRPAPRVEREPGPTREQLIARARQRTQLALETIDATLHRQERTSLDALVAAVKQDPQAVAALMTPAAGAVRVVATASRTRFAEPPPARSRD